MEFVQPEIDQLKYSAVFKEMEQHLHRHIQVQDEYRGKQNALAFLIKIMGNLDLENIDDLGPGCDFMEISEKSSENGEASYGIPQKTRAYEYLQQVQDKIDKDPPEVQIKVVKRLAEENHGMYKAAVEATERIEKQILIKKGLLNKEVENNGKKIARAQTELDDMILEKDHHKFQEMMNACRTMPVIRIKNQVSQGTVILGKESKLVVDQTIYGVKFFEKPDPVSKSCKIVVSGYYE